MRQAPEDRKAREQRLLEDVYGHNERSPARWKGLHELNVIAAERAGRATYWWTVVGACAAIIAAVAGIVAIYLG